MFVFVFKKKQFCFKKSNNQIFFCCHSKVNRLNQYEKIVNYFFLPTHSHAQTHAIIIIIIMILFSFLLANKLNTQTHTNHFYKKKTFSSFVKVNLLSSSSSSFSLRFPTHKLNLYCLFIIIIII